MDEIINNEFIDPSTVGQELENPNHTEIEESSDEVRPEPGQEYEEPVPTSVPSLEEEAEEEADKRDRTIVNVMENEVPSEDHNELSLQQPSMLTPHESIPIDTESALAIKQSREARRRDIQEEKEFPETPEVSSFQDPTKVPELPDEFKPEVIWQKAKDYASYVKDNPGDAAWAGALDSGKFWATEKDDFFAQALINVFEKVGNNVIRINNTLRQQVPEDVIDALVDQWGEVGDLRGEIPLMDINSFIGWEYQPKTTTGRLLMYPTELAITTLGVLKVLEKAGKTITVGKTIAAETGAVAMLTTPDDMSLADFLWQSDNPQIRDLSLEFFRTNGDSYAVKWFKMNAEEVIFNALVAFVGYSVPKTAGMLKSGVDRSSEWAKTRFNMRKQANQAADLLGDTVGTLKEIDSAKSIIMNATAKDSPDGAGRLVELAHTPVKPGSKTIPQFKLQQQDGFLMEDNPIATMARQMPPDTKGRASNIVKEYTADFVKNANRKDFYSDGWKNEKQRAKQLLQTELPATVVDMTRNLDKIDEYLSTPAAKSKKKEPIILSDKPEVHKTEPPLVGDPAFESFKKLEQNFTELEYSFDGTKMGPVPYHMFSDKGKVHLRESYDKMVANIEKKYHANLTPEDLPLIRDNPSELNYHTKLDGWFEGIETAWDKIVRKRYSDLSEGLFKFSEIKGNPTPKDISDLNNLISEAGKSKLIKKSELDIVIDRLMKGFQQEEGVISIGTMTYKQRLRNFGESLEAIVDEIDALHAARKRAGGVIFNRPIGNKSAAEYVKSEYDLLGPLRAESESIGIEIILRNLEDVDSYGLLKSSYLEPQRMRAYVGAQKAANYDMLMLRLRERSLRGKEHLRYDRHYHMAQQNLEKAQEDYVKQELKLKSEIDRRRDLLVRTKDAIVKQRERFAEYKKKVKAKEEVKDLKFETQMKNRERQFKEDIAAYEKDIEIRDKKIQELENTSTFLIDKKPPLANPNSKFVTVDSKNKVNANLSFLHTQDDFVKAIEEIKGHLYKNVQREPRLISDIFLTAWKRGEMLPPEVRKKVATKLGLLQDEMQDMSPYSEKNMRKLEKSWNAVDLAAMMKIVDASWDRLNALAKMASENSRLTPGELSALGISKQTYNKLRQGSDVSATLLFGEEFEKFFYHIYPQVWEGLQDTPTIISQARNMEDRLAFMGRIEDVITRVGTKGNKLKNISRMAEEFRAINEEGGYKGLQLFKKQIEMANLSDKPFWQRWLDSILFIRSTSMLSSVKTAKNIFTSGVVETGKKVFIEYPVESITRIFQGQATPQDAARELYAMHSFGWQNALVNTLKVLGKHADDLSGIINPMRHYRREYRFTRPYVDPTTSSVDQARQVRTNPLRFNPEKHGIFGGLSDMFAATQELAYFSIDTLDDSFKTINISFRLPIESMRQANIDAKNYMADAMAQADRVFEMKKAPKGDKNVVALEAYHKYLDDYDPNKYRIERYNYYLENPTKKMWENIQQHYRESTLLETLKDNGWVNTIYETLTKPKSFTHLWPFMLTQLNSFKNGIEQGVWRLPAEARLAYYLLRRKEEINKISKVMDNYLPGTPAYKRYEELITAKEAQFKEEMYSNSVLKHSVGDSSDPDEQAHQIARWVTGLTVTAGAVYVGVDMITGTPSPDVSNYEVAKKAMGVQDESVFLGRKTVSFGEDDSYRTGIYIPYRGEEPFGHFLRTAGDFGRLKMYLSDEQYKEAMHLLAWSAFNIYSPRVLRDIAKDSSFLIDLGNKDWDAAETKMLNLVKKKSEMFYGAADPLKIPPEVINKTGGYLKSLVDALPESKIYNKSQLKRDIDWAADQGDYWFPIGLKGIINDIRRWQMDKKTMEDEGEYLMRDITVEKAGHYEGVQEQFSLFRRVVDSILKNYRAKTPGISKELGPVLNLFGQPMRVSPNYGLFSIGAYMMPNTALGDRLRRADMEGAPAPELLARWERADLKNGGEPSQDADDMIDASMDAFPKEERKYNRYWAEVIRLGYQENWEGHLKSDKGWAARPILNTVSKSFEGRGSSFNLSHAQRNEVIWWTNNSKHTERSMVAKYGDKNMIDALDSMIRDNYLDALGDNQFDRQARKDALDQVISDYATLGKEKFMEANDEVTSALEAKSLGE